MEKNPKAVLVVQVSMEGIAAFSQVTGISREEFTGLRGVNGIDELVFEDEPQLLITGIISDKSSDVAKLVDRLRKKNPQLVAVTYSAVPIVGTCFDRQIEKSDGTCGRKVAQAIEEFHAGILRRNVVA